MVVEKIYIYEASKVKLNKLQQLYIHIYLKNKYYKLKQHPPISHSGLLSTPY